MTTRTKIGLVVMGYALALLIGAVAFAVSAAFTTQTAAPASGGMSAFGDALLFFGVFGVAALPPTGAALFFLRPYRHFWISCSILAAVSAATGLAACVYFVTEMTGEGWSILQAWSGPAVLRLLAAPLLALTFFLAGLFCPHRSLRVVLLSVAAVEAALCVSGALSWLHPAQPAL